ncbi:hypothetical protein [Caudoviricetes sp.]|nr:hypothetical protein [Caudoviricetes sp.]
MALRSAIFMVVTFRFALFLSETTVPHCCGSAPS